MERIKNAWKNLPLKKAFILTVLFFIGIVTLLSVATVLFCLWGRNYLLPNAKTAYLTVEKQYEDGTVVYEILEISLENGSWTPTVTGDAEREPGDETAGDEEGEPEDETADVLVEQGSEDETAENVENKKFLERYKIVKAENGYSYLSPKRKAAYRLLGAGMVLLPVLYTLLGILFSAVWFYRHKISRPIRVLESAIDQIQAQNLEFTVGAVGEDELGQVCDSLEEMRKSLYWNNRSMWNMLEERKRLQASVAHDLRNPITIIRTCVEYVKLNFPEGNMTEEQLYGLIDNVQVAAKRLEQYTDSIRDISKLEEVEVHSEPVDLVEILPEMEEELRLLAKKEQKGFMVEVPEGVLAGSIDVSLLYRILENLVANAARYAKKMVRISCGAKANGIYIRVMDDGPGFPQKVLAERKAYFTTGDAGDGHMGMGLSICRILCRKLDGHLKLGNKKEGGAEVEITFHRAGNSNYAGM